MTIFQALGYIVLAQKAVFYGLLAWSAVRLAPDFVVMLMAGWSPECARSARERGARNASHDGAESPRPVASQRPSRVSTSAPPCRPLFASDLTEATTSIMAGQGDAT